MVVCLLVGTAAATATGVKVGKALESDSFKKKVKAMKNGGQYEYVAVGEVNCRCNRSLQKGSSSKTINTSMAKINQAFDARSDNRILAVVRKPNGNVNFVLLKRPTGNKYLNKKDPFGSCSIDSNFKTDQGSIIEPGNIKIIIKNGNTFQFEDPNYKGLLSSRKVYEIQVKNLMRKAPSNGLSGKSLCELLTFLVKDGCVPDNFQHNSAERLSIDDKSESPDQTTQTSISNSSDDDDVSDASFDRAPGFDFVPENKNGNEDLELSKEDINISAASLSAITFTKNEQSFQDYEEDLITSTAITAATTATATAVEEDVIPVAIASPIE